MRGSLGLWVQHQDALHSRAVKGSSSGELLAMRIFLYMLEVLPATAAVGDKLGWPRTTLGLASLVSYRHLTMLL